MTVETNYLWGNSRYNIYCTQKWKTLDFLVMGSGMIINTTTTDLKPLIKYRKPVVSFSSMFAYPNSSWSSTEICSELQRIEHEWLHWVDIGTTYGRPQECESQRLVPAVPPVILADLYLPSYNTIKKNSMEEVIKIKPLLIFDAQSIGDGIITSTLDKLVDKFTVFVLCEQQTRVNSLQKSLAKKKLDNKIFIQRVKYSYEDILGLLKPARILISANFEMIELAVSTITPFIYIGDTYADKQVLMVFNISAHTIPTTKFTTKILLDMVNYLDKNAVTVFYKLENLIKQTHDIYYNEISKLEKRLRKNNPHIYEKLLCGSSVIIRARLTQASFKTEDNMIQGKDIGFIEVVAKV